MKPTLLYRVGMVEARKILFSSFGYQGKGFEESRV